MEPRQRSRPAESETTPRISRHPGVWAGYLALLGLGIPWYLPAAADRLFLGLPLWVLVCLGGNLALALYTAWVLRRFWKPPEDPQARRS